MLRLLSNRFRYLSPWASAMTLGMVVLLPVLVLLWLTHHETEQRALQQLRTVTKATLERSDRILDVVYQSLKKMVDAGHTTCSETDRKAMQEQVYRTIQIRGFGVLNRIGKTFHCTDLKVYEPPIPVTQPEHLVIGAPGEIAIVPPTEDLTKEISIFVNYGLPDGRILDAAVYPEQFWDFQDFLRLGDGGGVFLLNQDGNTISGFGELDGQGFANAKNGDSRNTELSALQSVRSSKRFPIMVVTYADELTVFRHWRRNAWITATVGFIAALLAGIWGFRLAERPHSMRVELRRAMRENSLELYYQPIYDLSTQVIVGAEALLRWYHPTMGQVPTEEFVTFAERDGLVPELSRWVFRQIKLDCQQLLARNPDFYISMNIGSEDLRREGIFDQALKASPELAKHLQIEITERQLIPGELIDAQAILRSWQALGVRIALDDFGTGYSNLAYLRNFALDVLKVDRMFVAAGDTEQGQGILDAVVQLAKTLKLLVIAEGIELPHHLGYVTSREIRYGQGWLFSKAEPVQALLDRLRVV